MNIKVNGKEKIFDKNELSVKEMLTICDVSQPDMVSVQLNGEFVQKEKFESTGVNDGDEIDFLYFMGGGGKSITHE